MNSNFGEFTRLNFEPKKAPYRTAVPNRTLRVEERVLNTINANERIKIFSGEIFTMQVASLSIQIDPIARGVDIS